MLEPWCAWLLSGAIEIPRLRLRLRLLWLRYVFYDLDNIFFQQSKRHSHDFVLLSRGWNVGAWHLAWGYPTSDKNPAFSQLFIYISASAIARRRAGDCVTLFVCRDKHAYKNLTLQNPGRLVLMHGREGFSSLPPN